MKRELPKPPKFQIRKQRIERVILTGSMEHIDAALDYMAKTHYVMSKVGPQMVRAGRAAAKDEKSFIILGEKVIR